MKNMLNIFKLTKYNKLCKTNIFYKLGDWTYNHIS